MVVVDDDLLLLETWRAILGTSFDVQAYSSPHEALKAFDVRPVEVALLDVQMPGKSGLDLLRAGCGPPCAAWASRETTIAPP